MSYMNVDSWKFKDTSKPRVDCIDCGNRLYINEHRQLWCPICRGLKYGGVIDFRDRIK